MPLTPRAVMAAVAVFVLAGCAARTTAPLDPSALVRARELVRQGCYDCLLEARDTYERIAAGGRLAVVTTRLFEVNLLLALRDKELALDPSEALARARALVPSQPPDVFAARYVRLVEAIPPDQIGMSRRSSLEYLAGLSGAEFRPDALGWLQQSALDPVVREYVALSLECSRPGSTEASSRPAIGADDTRTTLLAYRRSICTPAPRDKALEQIRADVPAFAEAALFQARGAFATVAGTDGSALRALLDEAAARFPRSPVVTYHRGALMQTLGDLRQAAVYYGDTLGLVPDHEDARLARAMCRTYLNEPDAAIADATVLIEAKAHNRGEAYYWRAFNLHRASKERRQGVPADNALEEARADIDRAKPLAFNSRVLTLAGIIEIDQKEIGIATADLTAATQMDVRNCAAHWYLGVARHTAEDWTDTGTAFAGAAGCYDASAGDSERQREIMAARTDLDPGFRARQLTGFDAAIREDRTQESAAALNAAIGYARARDLEAAERYIEQAKKDPARRIMAEDLRQVMRGPQ